MKIELQTDTDSNDLPIHRLLINNQEEVYIQDLSDCPEDAHIGRDLIDGADIIRYIEIGWDACKNGEKLEIIRTKGIDN